MDQKYVDHGTVRSKILYCAEAHNLICAIVFVNGDICAYPRLYGVHIPQCLSGFSLHFEAFRITPIVVIKQQFFMFSQMMHNKPSVPHVDKEIRI